MSARSIRYRLSESNNIWPGFVDILATLLIVIIFVLMVFTVSQIYLSDALTGRDKALQDLRKQINELSKILIIESQDKQSALKSLQETETDLKKQELYSQSLQSDIAKKESELFIQEQNIFALSDQIKDLLDELRIVAKALEIYEGAEITSLKTEGLGDRINKALANRIEQLNELNKDLDLANNQLALSQEALQIKNKELSINKLELQNNIDELNKLNNNLLFINESLGLEDAGLVEQLEAIKKKNDELISLNTLLYEKDEALQNKIKQYQQITNDLLAINDSLGLKDASLIEQLEAIRSKNAELAELNLNLVEKDNTIFNLRGKISELNRILTIGEDKNLSQEKKISELSQSLNLSQEEKSLIQNQSSETIENLKLRSSQTLKQVEFLTDEIDVLKNEINILNAALESSEQDLITKDLKIEVLGERLNKALTSKVFELQKYRSEFFGKIKNVLGDRKDIKIVGDRFIFESELLFDSASANLQYAGMEKLKQIGITLKDTTNEIPSEIDWIIQVEGHTDKRPINTIQYPSNWELSTARANSVLKLLLDLGFPPNRLSAAGYGEFYPLAEGDSNEILQQNRRIELKLTSR
tara:strand:+ start:1791 stop:3557 length:1767 start_codon:yes stop_codon:yes gene_type:complete